MSRLKKATFECEVLTPMFLGGADPNEAELRSATIRGGLRFWYRAYLGGQGILDTGHLNKQETEVFGSADTGGKVSLFVKYDEVQLERAEKYTKNNQGKPLANGTSYLWYSLTLGNNHKKGIKAGHRFNVTMRSRDPEAIKEAAIAFKLLAEYGGLGSRARRAAGSFRITKIASDVGLNTEPVHKMVLPDTPLPSKPAFNIYHSKYCETHKLSKTFPSWEKAVEHVGSRMQAFRFKHGMGNGGDYDQIKNNIQFHKKPEKLDRAHFGLPLSFRFRSLNGKGTKADIIGREKENRKASPILFSVGKEENQYYVNVIYFKSQFLPTGGQMTIGRTPVKPGDSAIITQFINTL